MFNEYAYEVTIEGTALKGVVHAPENDIREASRMALEKAWGDYRQYVVDAAGHQATKLVVHALIQA